MKKDQVFLCLDKDNYCNVCGEISTDELLSILGLNLSQLENWIDSNPIFEDKYVLVEKEPSDYLVIPTEPVIPLKTDKIGYYINNKLVMTFKNKNQCSLSLGITRKVVDKLLVKAKNTNCTLDIRWL